MALGGAERRQLRPHPATERPTLPRRPRRRAAAEGSCCTGEVGTGRLLGDTNGDCVFDIKDVRRASVLLLSQPDGATSVPTAYSGNDLCEWQRSQLDPTLDGAFKQNDAVYLLLTLAKK